MGHLIVSEGPSTLTLQPAQFETVRRLIYESIGLDLKPGKEALVAARLSKRLRSSGLNSVEELLEEIQRDTTGERKADLIDDLTTNFTAFWREPEHFEFIRVHVAPVLGRLGSCAVWSAACATGEEPYSLLFCLNAALGDKASRVRIVASDISRRALEFARRGVYPGERLRNLPKEWLPRFFQRGEGAWSGQYRVKPAFRSRIDFERRNLMDAFDELPACHLILCRNVMIYFDRATQENLVRRLSRRLTPGGWLLIGHSEGLVGFDHGLRYISPATYQRPA